MPCGFLGESLPQGLQIIGRAWDEFKIIGYAYAYEAATHYRQPPPTVPPLRDSLATRFIGTWRLIAIRERKGAAAPEEATKVTPEGRLIYASNSQLSLQIVRPGRNARSRRSGDDFISYFGRRELVPAEGHVIHYVDANLGTHQPVSTESLAYMFDTAGRLSLAPRPALTPLVLP